jgi:hypothetical protein
VWGRLCKRDRKSVLDRESECLRNVFSKWYWKCLTVNGMKFWKYIWTRYTFDFMVYDQNLK